MQAIRYIEDPVDILMRRRIQDKLHELLHKTKTQGAALFDCHEFGMCHAVPFAKSGGRPLFKYTWFQPAKREKLPKPRIVAIVTDTEGLWKNFRQRWFFALSKLGYLYCVSYEVQRQTTKGWETFAWYRSWVKEKQHPLLVIEDAIPEDWVLREAERLFKQRRRAKS